MTDERYAALVARLDAYSRAHPRRYQVQVAALALAGFGLMALLLGLAGAGLLILVGLALALLLSGGKALIVLLKFGKLLFLLAIPLWMLIRASVQALFSRFPVPEGHRLRPADAPVLFDALALLRAQLNGPRFHHVLLVDEVNAAVVQRPLFGLLGWPRNYLLLGLPLLERMTPDEALSVLAHEYGHLAGSHGRFGAWIYRLRLSWSGLQQLAGQWDGFVGRQLQRLIGWYAPYFNAYTHVLARANEYAADRASAELVGAGVAAQALKRVNLVAPQHQAFFDEVVARIRDEREPPADLAQRWAEAPPPAEPQAQAWLQQALQRQPQLHDTHPALAQRLAALPTAEPAEQLPALKPGQSAAERWLGPALPAWRQRFADDWRQRVASPWQAQHQAYGEQRVELEALQALAEPDRAQWRRRLQLRESLRVVDFNAVAEYRAFCAAHGDDLPGRYGLGVALLEAGDEAGLALLDAVMAEDAEATLPACECALRFLSERQDARAEAYSQRWRARHQLELERARQDNQLDGRHALVSAGLDSAQRRWMADLLNRHGKGVRKAYFARRVLPADPNWPSHVLALEFGFWARWRGQHQKSIDALAAADWPVGVICCELKGPYKPLRKKLLALGAAAQLR